MLQAPGGAVYGQHTGQGGLHGGSPHLADILAGQTARHTRRSRHSHPRGATPLTRYITSTRHFFIKDLFRLKPACNHGKEPFFNQLFIFTLEYSKRERPSFK